MRNESAGVASAREEWRTVRVMTRTGRLFAYWVYGGVLAGVLLLALLPVISKGWPGALVLTFLCLPSYMLHQYEEYDDDRFRLYVNREMGKGRELLTHAAVFVINVPGVWGVVGLAFVLAARVDLGYGLIGGYLLLVNALIHIAAALVSRAYNPGLWSALFLFLPVGGACVVSIVRADHGSWPMQALGLGIAFAIHLAIVVYVKRIGFEAA